MLDKETMKQYPIERDKFCEIFAQVMGIGFDWFNLFYDYTYENFHLWHKDDTWYIVNMNTGLLICWYKNLGRVLECNKDNVTEDEIQKFFTDLKEDMQLKNENKKELETEDTSTSEVSFNEILMTAIKNNWIEKISFDTDYNSKMKDKTPYIKRAQLLPEIILDKKPKAIYAGVSAESYLCLAKTYHPISNINCQSIYEKGVFKDSSSKDIPVYKVSSSIIPHNFIYLDCLLSTGKFVCVEVLNLKDQCIF